MNDVQIERRNMKNTQNKIKIKEKPTDKEKLTKNEHYENPK